MNLSDILNHHDGPASVEQQQIQRPIHSDERTFSTSYHRQASIHQPPLHDQHHHDSFIPRTPSVPIPDSDYYQNTSSSSSNYAASSASSSTIRGPSHEPPHHPEQPLPRRATTGAADPRYQQTWNTTRPSHMTKPPSVLVVQNGERAPIRGRISPDSYTAHATGRPTTVPHSQSVPSSTSTSSSSSPTATPANMPPAANSTPNPNEDISGPPRCSYCDDCTTRSPLRKVVSHVFGRNKAETRAIPQTVWVYYCRKHYQRSRYRNPNGFAVLQCELVRRQIDRLIAWGGVENWSVKVRKGGKDGANPNGRPNGGYMGGDMDMEEDMADMDEMMPPMNLSMNSSNNTSSSNSPSPPNLQQDPNSTTWLAKFEGHGKTMQEIKHLVDEIEKSLEIIGGTFPDVELLPHCYTTPSHEDEENGWMKESHRRKSGPRGGSGRKVRNKAGALGIQTSSANITPSTSSTRLSSISTPASIPPHGSVRRRMTTGDVALHSPSILIDTPHQYHHHHQHHPHPHYPNPHSISASTSPEATEFDESIFTDPSTPRTPYSYSHPHRPRFPSSTSYSYTHSEDDTRTPTPTHSHYHHPQPPCPQHPQAHLQQQHHQHQQHAAPAPPYQTRDITPPGSAPASSRRTSLENKIRVQEQGFSVAALLPPSPKSLRRYDERGAWIEQA